MLMIRVISYHWSWSGSSHWNVPQIWEEASNAIPSLWLYIAQAASFPDKCPINKPSFQVRKPKYVFHIFPSALKIAFTAIQRRLMTEFLTKFLIKTEFSKSKKGLDCVQTMVTTTCFWYCYILESNFKPCFFLYKYGLTEIVQTYLKC